MPFALAREVEITIFFLMLVAVVVGLLLVFTRGRRRLVGGFMIIASLLAIISWSRSSSAPQTADRGLLDRVILAELARAGDRGSYTTDANKLLSYDRELLRDSHQAGYRVELSFESNRLVVARLVSLTNPYVFEQIFLPPLVANNA